MMWLVFILVLFFVFLLILVGSTGSPRHTSKRALLQQPPQQRAPKPSIAEPPLEPPFGPKPPRRVEETVLPRRVEETVLPRRVEEIVLPRRVEQTVAELADLFAPVYEPSDVDPTPVFDESEIADFFSEAAPFTGRPVINWDARCRLTGETHRVCLCDDCRTLRGGVAWTRLINCSRENV